MAYLSAFSAALRPVFFHTVSLGMSVSQALVTLHHRQSLSHTASHSPYPYPALSPQLCDLLRFELANRHVLLGSVRAKDVDAEVPDSSYFPSQCVFYVVLDCDAVQIYDL